MPRAEQPHGPEGSLPVEKASSREPVDTDPEITPGQDNLIDLRVNQGFNYFQARIMAGVLPVRSQVEDAQDFEEPGATEPAGQITESDAGRLQPEKRTAKRPGRNNDGSIDRRTLSPRGQIAADKKPSKRFPYVP